MDGALLLDKPIGVSSNRVLQDVKKIFGAKKAGHAGTLDPLASGLLVVLFGEATKFAGPQLDADKEYLATLKLGERTSTADAEGRLLEKKAVEVSNGAVLSVLERFRGAIEQLPPMHSALKRGGVPLYKLARRGETVERKARPVQIFELETLVGDLPRKRLDAAEEARFRKGQALSMPGLAAGIFAVLRPDGSVIGLGKADAAGALKPLRLTATMQAADNQLKSPA